MKKILVLGYFGYKTNQLDGQTVKTRNLYILLKQDNQSVSYFDTQVLRYSKLSIFKMLLQVCRCDVVCYVPAHNNLKYFFPIIFILSKLFSTKIHYYVVGGWLNEFIRKLPIHRWMLKNIDYILPETQLMCEKLKEDYNILNTQVFPNFRITDFSASDERHPDNPLRMVFMARVNKMKGYETIFTFADYAIQAKLDVVIDFFGPIYDDDKDDFMQKIALCPITSYQGTLEPEDIYLKLCSYDLLLLPTRYYTEGFPGSILDAYISGIPVIVTGWKHAREFVVDGETGIIVPFKDSQESFNQAITKLYYDREKLDYMRKRSKDFSEYFKADYALNIIRTLIS